MRQSSDSSFSLSAWITIIFVILKLTGTITWSWWWVFSPLWISFAFSLLIAAIGAVILLIFRTIKAVKNDKYDDES